MSSNCSSSWFCTSPSLLQPHLPELASGAPAPVITPYLGYCLWFMIYRFYIDTPTSPFPSPRSTQTKLISTECRGSKQTHSNMQVMSSCHMKGYVQHGDKVTSFGHCCSFLLFSIRGCSCFKNCFIPRSHHQRISFKAGLQVRWSIPAT